MTPIPSERIDRRIYMLRGHVRDVSGCDRRAGARSRRRRRARGRDFARGNFGFRAVEHVFHTPH